jgi:orotate phosphoribosyltransferase
MPSETARSPSWDAALQLVKGRGHEQRKEPFRLASGQLSHDYIDGKYATDTGTRLRIVCEAMSELAIAKCINFNAVGGLTMGADHLSHGIALVTDSAWFSVRKEPKPRGHGQWIEGTHLTPDNRVLLVDDVVSTGSSTLKAYERVIETGASVTGVIPMVDRGEIARRLFEARGIPYVPLVTYRDLGIDPIRES